MESSAGIAALSIGQTVTVYSLFLPPLSTVRESHEADQAIRADVRLGQVGGAVVSLTVGFLLSNLSGSMVPFAVTAVIALTMSGVYETAMRSRGVNSV